MFYNLILSCISFLLLTQSVKSKDTSPKPIKWVVCRYGYCIKYNTIAYNDTNGSFNYSLNCYQINWSNWSLISCISNSDCNISTKCEEEIELPKPIGSKQKCVEGFCEKNVTQFNIETVSPDSFQNQTIPCYPQNPTKPPGLISCKRDTDCKDSNKCVDEEYYGTVMIQPEVSTKAVCNKEGICEKSVKMARPVFFGYPKGYTYPCYVVRNEESVFCKKSKDCDYPYKCYEELPTLLTWY